MGGLLSSLNTSYTGLTGHQVMVDTTGNNIANANNEFYTRQFVRPAAETPLWKQNYALGQGLAIQTIERAHHEFTFARYRKGSVEKTYADETFKGLREASSFYPEIDKVGIYNDLSNYFDSWKALSTKAGDSAQKNTLIEHAKTLTSNINQTRERLVNLQQRLNDELKVTIDEVNRLGEQIATLNKKINEYENSQFSRKANDLRDLRDRYEFEMNNLIGVVVDKNALQGSGDYKVVDFDSNYHLWVGGHAIVSGSTFRPLVADNITNSSSIYSIKYVRDDHKVYDLTNDLNQGRVGAILDLIRNGEVIGANGTLGKLQTYIDDLDTFANGFIEATNNLYAQSSQLSLHTDSISISGLDALTTSGYNVREGSFDVVIYGKDGKEVAKRSIQIDNLTNINSIVEQLNANVDDKADGNASNDFDDYFQAVFNNDTRTFSIVPKNPSNELFISIQDHGTNFAGAFGVNRLFDGFDARTIEVATKFREDPTLLNAYREPVDGDFKVANLIQEMQNQKIIFTSKDREQHEETISGYFRLIASKVASDTQSAQTMKETKESVYQAIKQEYKEISQVSVDEELVNLIRFQSGYSANAKLISTIDEMITTLLGIKN